MDDVELGIFRSRIGPCFVIQCRLSNSASLRLGLAVNRLSFHFGLMTLLHGIQLMLLALLAMSSKRKVEPLSISWLEFLEEKCLIKKLKNPAEYVKTPLLVSSLHIQIPLLAIPHHHLLLNLSHSLFRHWEMRCTRANVRPRSLFTKYCPKRCANLSGCHRRDPILVDNEPKDVKICLRSIRI
jgi:hypothetical protein